MLCSTPRKIWSYFLDRFSYAWWLQDNDSNSFIVTLVVVVVKPESKLWHSIKKNLPDIFWTRIESWALPGVPDCYGCKDGVMFWLELKTSTKVNKAKLSPFQKSWHFSHARQGGRSFIMHQILGERLICIFSSSIVPSIGALSPKHASKCWALPASPAAWTEMQDYILHSPLQKPALPEA